MSRSRSRMLVESLESRVLLAATPIELVPQTTFSAGFDIRSPFVADFNNDGAPDLGATRVGGGGGIVVYLNDGSGTFLAPIVTPLPSGSIQISGGPGDLNGDGFSDFVIQRFDAIQLIFGTGTGTFTPGPVIPTLGTSANTAWRASLADFNEDGRDDILLVNGDVGPTPSRYRLFLSNASGGFTPAPFNTTTLNESPRVLVADFNDDTHLDVALQSSSVVPGVEILLGDGTGQFAPPAYPTGDFSATDGLLPLLITAADFDNDGDTDILSYHNGLLRTFVAYNNGNLNFTLGEPFPFVPSSIEGTGDFNGDGATDLIAINIPIPNSLERTVRLNDGTGGFDEELHFGSTAITTQVVADFNSDGFDDIILVHFAPGVDAFTLYLAREITPEDQLTSLIGDFDVLIGTDVLPPGIAKTLRARLDNALEMLADGDTQGAVAAINSFVKLASNQLHRAPTLEDILTSTNDLLMRLA